MLHADHKHNRIRNLPWLVTSGPQQPLCPSQWPRNSTISRCLTSQLGNMAKNQNQTGQSSPGRVILAICLLEASQPDYPKSGQRRQESWNQERSRGDFKIWMVAGTMALSAPNGTGLKSDSFSSHSCGH